MLSPGVQETEERKGCLELAETAGLDIPNITKMVVENIRKQYSNDFIGEGDLNNDAAITEVKCKIISWPFKTM